MRAIRHRWQEGGRMVATWALVGIALGLAAHLPAVSVALLVAAWLI